MKKNKTINIIISIDDPIFYGSTYCAMIRSSPEKIDKVFILPGPSKSIMNIIYNLRFIRLKGLIYILIKYLIHKHLKKDTLYTVAKKYNIPVQKIQRLEECFDYLSEKNCDLVFASTYKIVPQKALKLAKIGWLNIHCGKLPKYAGINAPFWTMLNNEKELSVTIHFMEEKLDSGRIIYQKSIPNKGSYFKLTSQLFNIAAQFYCNLIRIV